MIYLITGSPGAKKTAYCVSILDKVENDNKINLVKNIEIYKHNLDVLTAKNLLNELAYIHLDVGSGHTLQRDLHILDDDYFDILHQDFDYLRPDDYYKRATQFNQIIERIQDLHGDIGLKYFLPVRTIYSNINALRIDYTRSLEHDWRTCPDGSIIVIDEIQLVPPFNETKDKTNPIVTDLSVHRHRGFDFYIITQSAGNLHTLIKDLIHVHYHVTCPFGWKTKIYHYGEFKANPNALTVRARAEQVTYFTPSQHIFKLYKSTTINTAKARPPYKHIIGILSVCLFGLGLIIWAMMDTTSPADDVNSKLDKTNAPQETSQSNDNVITNAIQESKQIVQNKADEEQGVPLEYLTKDELIEYVKTREKHAKNELEKYKLQVEKDRLEIRTQYDLLQKQLLEHDKQIQDFYAKLELYKRQLPKNYEITKNDPNLQVRAVVKKGDKCNAYNTHGDLMTLSFDECDYYLKAVGRVHKGNGQTTNIKADPVPKIMNDNPDFGKTEPQLQEPEKPSQAVTSS